MPISKIFNNVGKSIAGYRGLIKAPSSIIDDIDGLTLGRRWAKALSNRAGRLGHTDFQQKIDNALDAGWTNVAFVSDKLSGSRLRQTIRHERLHQVKLGKKSPLKELKPLGHTFPRPKNWSSKWFGDWRHELISVAGEFEYALRTGRKYVRAVGQYGDLAFRARKLGELFSKKYNRFNVWDFYDGGAAKARDAILKKHGLNSTYNYIRGQQANTKGVKVPWDSPFTSPALDIGRALDSMTGAIHGIKFSKVGRNSYQATKRLPNNQEAIIELVRTKVRDKEQDLLENIYTPHINVRDINKTRPLATYKQELVSSGKNTGMKSFSFFTKALEDFETIVRRIGEKSGVTQTILAQGPEPRRAKIYKSILSKRGYTPFQWDDFGYGTEYYGKQMYVASPRNKPVNYIRGQQANIKGVDVPWDSPFAGPGLDIVTALKNMAKTAPSEVLKISEEIRSRGIGSIKNVINENLQRYKYNVKEDAKAPYVILQGFGETRAILGDSILGKGAEAAAANIGEIITQLEGALPSLSTRMRSQLDKGWNHSAFIRTDINKVPDMILHHEFSHVYDLETGIKNINLSRKEWIDWGKFLYKKPMYRKLAIETSKAGGHSIEESAMRVARLELVGYANASLTGLIELNTSLPSLTTMNTIHKVMETHNIKALRDSAMSLVQTTSRSNRPVIAIPGMPEGGVAAEMRRLVTDHGSPWRGMYNSLKTIGKAFQLGGFITSRAGAATKWALDDMVKDAFMGNKAAILSTVLGGTHTASVISNLGSNSMMEMAAAAGTVFASKWGYEIFKHRKGLNKIAKHVRRYPDETIRQVKEGAKFIKKDVKRFVRDKPSLFADWMNLTYDRNVPANYIRGQQASKKVVDVPWDSPWAGLKRTLDAIGNIFNKNNKKFTGMNLLTDKARSPKQLSLFDQPLKSEAEILTGVEKRLTQDASTPLSNKVQSVFERLVVQERTAFQQSAMGDIWGEIAPVSKQFEFQRRGSLADRIKFNELLMAKYERWNVNTKAFGEMHRFELENVGGRVRSRIAAEHEAIISEMDRLAPKQSMFPKKYMDTYPAGVDARTYGAELDRRKLASLRALTKKIEQNKIKRNDMQRSTNLVKDDTTKMTTPGLARSPNRGGSRKMPRGGS